MKNTTGARTVRFFFCSLLAFVLGCISAYAQSDSDGGARHHRSKKAAAADANTEQQSAPSGSGAPQQAPAPAQENASAADQQNADGQSPQDAELKKKLTAPAPVLEIKRLESEKPLYSIELRDVPLPDLFRVIAHDYNLNIIIDPEIEGTITASFTNIALDEALDSIAEMSNLILEKKGSIIKVSPNLISKTIVLKYVSAKTLIESAPAAQAGSQSGGQPGVPGASGQTTGGQGQASGAAASQQNSISGLLSSKGKILLGQQQNSLTVIDYPENVTKICEYLKVIDQGLTTRVFKLKYLKADEVTGVTQVTSTTTQTTTATGTSSETKTTATKQQ